jgi:hypothetical protein
MGKMIGAGGEKEILDELEPELHKNGPPPQHWTFKYGYFFKYFLILWVVGRYFFR